MRTSALASTFLVLVAAVAAEDIAPVKRQADCSVWTDVAADLVSQFQTDGVCNDVARQAIRLPFHDCFPEACDGSIILSDECSRTENQQMAPVCSSMSGMVTQYNISAADLVALGAAIGIASCTGGPSISFLTGRESTSTANPTGQMPSGNTSAADLISLFQAKGFSSDELVALVGAHSTGKNLDGVALDSTVDAFDNTYYAETADGTAPATIPADANLANATTTSSKWQDFAGSNSDWLAAFVPAMEKLMVLGNDASSLTDCSSVVTGSLSARSVKFRRHW